jgi:hypothetical protein
MTGRCGLPHGAYQVKSYDMHPAFYPREKHICTKVTRKLLVQPWLLVTGTIFPQYFSPINPAPPRCDAPPPGVEVVQKISAPSPHPIHTMDHSGCGFSHSTVINFPFQVGRHDLSTSLPHPPPFTTNSSTPLPPPPTQILHLFTPYVQLLHS